MILHVDGRIFERNHEFHIHVIYTVEVKKCEVFGHIARRNDGESVRESAGIILQ